MREINQLDLFSGIGGFHKGFAQAGYKVNSYFSEVDKHAIAVYKNQFENATYVGSVDTIQREQLPNIDLITFGSPCQDFSLSGKRRGMQGERSSLILEAIRLINDICRAPAIDLNGNCLIHRGFYHKTESGFTLSDMLQHPSEVGEEYSLSEKVMEAILSNGLK